MMKTRIFCFVASLLCAPLHAQDIPGALRKLDEAKALLQPPPNLPATVVVPLENPQATIDAAPAGSMLALSPGVTYPSLTLTGDGKALTTLGAVVNGRVDPTIASAFAKVPHLTVVGTHWTVRNVEVIGDPNLVENIWCDPSAAHIVFDGLYVHGQGNIRRAFALNCTDATITHSDVRDFKAYGVETQAIGGWYGPGPYLIEDNYLEAACENIMFGGGDPTIVGLVPSDITIRHNTILKPESWRGQALNAKNLLELKNARRVVIEDNDFSGSWHDAHVGFAIALTVRNQDRTAPWSTVQDVTIRNNRISRVGGGVQILGKDDQRDAAMNPIESVRMARVTIDSNRFDLDPHPGDAVRLFQISGGPEDLQITNNVSTLPASAYLGTMVSFGWPDTPLARLVVSGNDFVQGEYGIAADGLSMGQGALDTVAPGYVWNANTVRLNGRFSPVRYPLGTTIVP